MIKTISTKRRKVTVLLIIILIVRLGMAWLAFSYPDRFVLIDSQGYLQLADNIRQTGRFEATEYLEEVRTPGYPFFIAAIQAIFGETIGLIILIQLVFTVLITWLLYRGGSLLFSERIGLAAAWLYVLNPNALFWSLTILTEPLFALLLVLSLSSLLKASKHLRLHWYALSGFLLGMATLTRPISLYLIPIWTLIIILMLRSKHVDIGILKPTATFLVAAIVLVLYWQTRNLVLHNRFTLSSTTEVTISRFIATDTLAEALRVTRDEARLTILEAPDPMAYSLEVIRQYPSSFIKITIRGIARTMLGTEVGTWMQVLFDQPFESSGLLTALVRLDIKGMADALLVRLQEGENPLSFFLLLWGVIYAIILFLLAAIGVTQAFRSDILSIRWPVIILLVSVGYLILIPQGNGDARFRVPAGPLLAMLGSLTWLPRRRSGQV